LLSQVVVAAGLGWAVEVEVVVSVLQPDFL
jgi:hypothetical protein